ncbi:MAG: phage portal protein [Pirellulales bacterium]|nr:phage portal protein [Pirellulales bacterium]
MPSQRHNDAHASAQQGVDETLDEALAERGRLLAAAVKEENRILRESFSVLQGFVDPQEAYQHDGELWEPLDATAPRALRTGFANLRELADARSRCRELAMTNEFAINGHENRISYVIGNGHQYRVIPRSSLPQPGQDENDRGTTSDGETSDTHRAAADSHLITAAQDVIDEFLELNAWRKRQTEALRRIDRDGEAFLWFFVDELGVTRVRFVEPDLVATPDHVRVPNAGDQLNGVHGQGESTSFGVVTDGQDVETVLAYWVDGEQVDAAEIQHRKANVDANIPRGVPLFYPVLRTLRWADNLLRNMAAVSDIQTAIALIRKHQAAGRNPLEALRSSAATLTTESPTVGREYFQEYKPGAILDVYADTEYDFPARGLDAARYVLVLQAILRAVASRLVMPEFMLTSDASNANYSSTLVAEGPAVKMFERLQHDMMDDDRAVMRRVLRNAATAGRLPEDILRHVRIQIEPPRVTTRNRLDEIRADAILVRNGAMTAEQMAMRNG